MAEDELLTKRDKDRTLKKIFLSAVITLFLLIGYWISTNPETPLEPTPSDFTNSIGMEFMLVPPAELAINKVNISETNMSEALLFSWDEVPGNDSGRLIEFLEHKFNIGWITTADIEKTDGGKIIILSYRKEKSLLLRLNEEKNMVMIEIDYDNAPEYFAKTEKGTLNVYNITPPKSFLSPHPKAFYIGKYEVTQKQWREVMGNNPSFWKGDDLPVEQVSWFDVQEFIKRLNEKESTNKYRLPSEAEWEFSAQADTTTRYFLGEDESKIGDYAWYRENSRGRTHTVGRKKPNQWGIYDMYGNVWEWIQYRYGYSEDDLATTMGEDWFGRYPLSNSQGSFPANSRTNYIGFRLVRDL